MGWVINRAFTNTSVQACGRALALDICYRQNKIKNKTCIIGHHGAHGKLASESLTDIASHFSRDRFVARCIVGDWNIDPLPCYPGWTGI